MGNHPSNHERKFIDLIGSGYLYLNIRGEIWRAAIKNPNKPRIDIKPRRAERKNKDGYLQVRLRHNGKEYSCMAHRIVWTFTNGRIPEGYEINHKDGHKENNRLDNLELVTSSENQKHAYANGLKVCNNIRDPITGQFT